MSGRQAKVDGRGRSRGRVGKSLISPCVSGSRHRVSITLRQWPGRTTNCGGGVREHSRLENPRLNCLRLTRANHSNLTRIRMQELTGNGAGQKGPTVPRKGKDHDEPETRYALRGSH